MWKSWGDKYEIIPYDKEKRPRKFKYTYPILGTLLVICFVTSRWTFVNMLPETGFRQFIPVMVLLLSVIACLVLFVAKWKKNNKECDLTLVFIAVILLFLSWVASPYF